MVVLVHLIGEVVDLLAGVAVDNGLGDGQSLVKILQSVELPLLLLNRHVELSDTFKGKLGSLDQNSDWIAHKLASQLHDFLGHGGREQSDLHVAGQQLEHIIELLLETWLEHLISLINNEDLEVVQLQNLFGCHVINTTGGTNNHVLALTELIDVLTDGSTTDASVAANLHIVTQGLSNSGDLLDKLSGGGQDQSLANLLREVDFLQTSNHESTSFTGTGLGLTDSIAASKERSDGSLLNSRWLLETIRVDTTEEVLVQIQVIERLDRFVELLISGHFAKCNFFGFPFCGPLAPNSFHILRDSVLSFMSLSSPDDSFPDSENTSSLLNVNESKEVSSEPKKVHESVPISHSPNTLRKRRREEIARKVESRKALISTASSTRLDMTKVHSILSGPRLSWDWQNGVGAKHDAEDDDDSCGLVVDFHQDSRSALKTHISKTMSQMASRDISSQSLPSTVPGKVGRPDREDIKQIIQMKRRLIATQAIQANKDLEPDHESDADDFAKDDLPQLEPIEIGEQQDFIHAWQETQLPPAPTISQSQPLDSTQVFVRLDSPIKAPNGPGFEAIVEEEIQMDDDVGSTQIYIKPTEEVPAEPVSKLTRSLKPQISKASSTVSIPPNSLREDDAAPSESSAGEAADSEESEEEAESASDPSSPEEVEEEPRKRSKKGRSDLSFEEWLAERQRKKKLLKKRGASGGEGKMFIEAEAEESEDEELGGIVRRAKVSGDEEDEEGSSSDDDSDLEDLVASARDEFELLKKSGKDSSKLAKLHAKWLEEKDAELQKAIEEREFWRRKRSGLRGIDEGDETGGLNRLQRKLKAKREAYVEQFDSEGNLLAPEFVDDSDYDSMDIDSDEFFDEFSDEEQREELDEEELAIRRERKEREKERKRKDRELKMEMEKRRQLLKAKLREERLMKEKDKREIHSGLGIMTEEDREAFKLVSRTQGGFGYSQVGASSGITTQSTSASASSQVSPVFSFLKSTDMKPSTFKMRRSSAASLELE